MGPLYFRTHLIRCKIKDLRGPKTIIKHSLGTIQAELAGIEILSVALCAWSVDSTVLLCVWHTEGVLTEGSLPAVRRPAELEPVRGSGPEGCSAPELTCDSHVPAVFALVNGVHDLLRTAHKALGTPLETNAITRGCCVQRGDFTEGQL